MKVDDLLSPALMEELIFRVLPLPRDATRVTKPRLALLSTVYLISKSLWPPVLLHWTAVVTWITLLGGQAALRGYH